MLLLLRFCCSCLLLASFSVLSAKTDEASIYQYAVQADFAATYKTLHSGLQAEGFRLNALPDFTAYSVSDKQYQYSVKKINRLTIYQSQETMEISQLEPALLALFPLRLTLIKQADMSIILFLRPSHLAQADSPALPLLRTIEQKIIQRIEQTLSPLASQEQP
ncbi:hypothetical protein [Candidatus Venteria ishoeyi]|uniref:DUF302 domain-containing protein n=1 Tax=Candidatus Venteria ishoeyi TaxID=1899563 RepID=A0A1H6FCW9_9GAMM|nr:hypothetical protein [Candidatus Venteria ishoeyi]MDM8545017.1 hypothetical protein [Candidatus Venteria ishoeyi]SEH07006.1 Uncharacterised protein [Candidatus Venteria ishoeyi]